MKLQKLFNAMSRIEKSFMIVLFTNKIDNRKVLFERKYNREMGIDEIEKYKFSLFTVYVLIAMSIILIPFIFIFT
ncbi:hypothetical protein ACQKDB_15835 [Planococcus kocurii]|uniref:hypothetical protein n=1 Tax=Planococcus kocurii TaxID=1374 RepID=UPI003CFE88BB